ncbi:N(4)-(Beta-N-acetylglucosaminyl)-L-asparaginase [Echinococcus granulosus]|uniref:N(4)-(Beta-N-acetylglucosaminyl)-L-asparaginase n=1 Tax=Echinococcus granulosus TaxID=6210 RepID=W6UAI7_ECHGR|nr:N(4)-(Beta-N-acetylglucosaminyl)-L-asparaginase [Echinococcus granulosus]EUB55447.1 N(4)-(Beta-N-acetylglucosaminyl)-L-asparaginase [Echinococcus granulosus]
MLRLFALSTLCCATVLATNHIVFWSQIRPYSGPTVINTWPWKGANDAAWGVIKAPTGSALAAVVAGCTAAEEDKNIASVGAGGSPDEDGNTTLSAMVMDGDSMNVGAVAEMGYIKEAAQVALGVLNSTRHTLLVGEAATRFAESLGYHRTNLSSNESTEVWKQWKLKDCQPNFRIPYSWIPNPRNSCGPYQFKNKSWADLDVKLYSYCQLITLDIDGQVLRLTFISQASLRRRQELGIDKANHDTIGVIALDRHGKMAVGLSTNGARFRIPGRVGDSPIPGAGGFADSRIGAAAGTGDGDIMMRFLLSFKAVELMKAGKHPNQACYISLRSVRQRGTWYGALIALRADGQYGAACVGFKDFAFIVQNHNSLRGGKVIKVKCIPPHDLHD